MSVTRWHTVTQAPRLHEEDTWFYFTCVHCGEDKSGYDIERCFRLVGPECKDCRPPEDE